MALRMTQKRRQELTPIQQGYIDILVNEYFLYFGRLPHGHKQKVADRLGCSVSYLTQLDGGTSPLWMEKRNEAFRNQIPIADPMAQLGLLQHMLDNALEQRKVKGVPLTSKDPADLVDAARKITHGEAYLKTMERTRQPAQHTTFNIQGLSDEGLDKALQWVTQQMRRGGAEELGDIIEGSWRETPDGPVPGLESGEGQESPGESEETAPDGQ